MIWSNLNIYEWYQTQNSAEQQQQQQRMHNNNDSKYIFFLLMVVSERERERIQTHKRIVVKEMKNIEKGKVPQTLY